MQKKNVFVLGLNEINRQRLEKLPHADECNFHSLLSYEESHGARNYDIKSILEKAIRQLDEFDGSIDAITGFWDFPVSIMQTILAQRYETRGTSTQSVYFCEDKYGARVKQKEVIPECVPGFNGFNPFDDNPQDKISLDYPFWIKPVKSFGSHLGFLIENEDDFKNAIPVIREKIERFTKPFFNLVDYASMDFKPDQKILCIAEEIISGHQCTLEGSVFEDEVRIHGVVDSHRYKGMSTFSFYSYPSQLPESVKERMTEYTKKIMPHIGFNNSTFNIEYYWDEETDDIKLLEINPRISQSHAELFRKVDGAFNLKIIVDVALGYPPSLPDNEGPFAMGGKFFIRHFKNGMVKKAPGDKEIEKVHEQYSDVVLDLISKEGEKLEDLAYQDSYSYKLGFAYLGGESIEDMQEKFENVKRILDYQIEDL